jgi:hypothetical protein
MSEDEFDVHFDAICAAMSSKESKTVRLMFEELAFQHRLIWVRKLSGMSVPEGVAFFRKQLAEAERNAPPRSAVEPRVVRAANAARAPGAAPSATATPHRDGRRAAGSPAPSKPPTAATAGAPIAGLSTVSPGTQSQIAAIQRELTPDEDLAMRRYVAALSSAERSAWIATLLVLPVPEAVAMIRERLAEDRPHAGQRDATAIAGAPHAPATAAQPAQRNRTMLAPESSRSSSAEVAVPHDEPRVREDRLMPMRVLSSSAEVAVPREELPERDALLALASATSASSEAGAPREELPSRNALPAPASAALASPKTRMPHEEQSVPATLADRDPSGRAEVPLSTDATPSVSMPSAPQRRVDMDADTHLLAIEHALTDGERFLVHAMIAQLPTDERRVWQDKLLSVPVAEAAAILRLVIQELTADTLPVDTRASSVPDPLDLAPAHDRTFADGQQPGDSGALDHNLEYDDEQASDADGQLEEDQELDDGQDLDDEGEIDGGQELDDEERLDDGQEFDDEQPYAGRDRDHRAPVSGSATGSGAALTAPVSSATAPNGGLPTLSPDAFSHFKAIEAALPFAERMRVYELGAQFSAAEVTAWIDELAPLPLSEAVAKVRAALAVADGAQHKATKGGVS